MDDYEDQEDQVDYEDQVDQYMAEEVENEDDGNYNYDNDYEEPNEDNEDNEDNEYNEDYDTYEERPKNPPSPLGPAKKMDDEANFIEMVKFQKAQNKKLYNEYQPPPPIIKELKLPQTKSVRRPKFKDTNVVAREPLPPPVIRRKVGYIVRDGRLKRMVGKLSYLFYKSIE